MSEQPKTKGEQVIEKIMAELDPASERYQVLAVASTFKSSWVALGEKLLRVKQSGTFRDWGYADFEDYCSKEVRIKKPTAQKLTLAYGFIEREEPQLMARHTELQPLPDYRSIELLRQAREEKNIPSDDYAELRRAVLEENRSHPTIQKRFNDVTSRTDEPTVALPKQLNAALQTGRRLQTLLAAIEILPGHLNQALNDLTGWLQEQVEDLSSPKN